MRRNILIIALLLFGLHKAYVYFLSEDFQKYGDKTKKPWTCKFNNTLGQMYIVGSEYQLAINLFDRTIARCPETPMADEAMYQKGDCLESLNHPQQALVVFQAYKEAFPNGNRSSLVDQAINRIKLTTR